MPGAAAYEGGNFPGDETTDWTRSSGLASLTTDMLNRAIGGAYGFTADIGGYFDIGPYQATTKELFVRWTEWTALSPFFRLHGSVGAGTHTPWSYDDETLALYKQMSALHVRARPLILRLWAEARQTGIPVTRPLWLAAPGDPQAAGQDQEWMLGDDVLVAPVVTQGARARSVYLPAGCWQREGGGEQLAGGSEITVQAALAQLPWFVRCGTDPLGPAPSAACRSNRRVLVSVPRLRRGERVRSVRASGAGRRLPARRVRGRRFRVDLRGLPKARVHLRLLARTSRGRTIVWHRTFRTCTPGDKRAA